MIFKKEIKRYKKNGEPEYKLKFNKEFWLEAQKKYKNFNVILDEAHILLSSRNSMSTKNKIMMDFLAVIRKIIGGQVENYILYISQLDRRLDIIAREMCNNVKYCRCWFNKTCKECNYTWIENNETPEPLFNCPRCQAKRPEKTNHLIEVWHFQNINLYESWRVFGLKTYHQRYFITDIEQYFGFYNTLQWDNLLSDETLDMD